MVSATEVAGILRVEFVLTRNVVSETSIVCFVRAMEKGIDICYSHTIGRTRPAEKGLWTLGSTLRMALTPEMENSIRVGVMHELWGACENRVRVLPVPINTSLKIIDWQRVEQAELEGREFQA
jgi:hypothetical protein